jgi:SsrA-binding protein
LTKETENHGNRLITDNRKAGFDYHFLEIFEAGLALQGTEVKAIREGGANLRDSFCRLDKGEAYLVGAHIGQYSHGGSATHDPIRPRKLLLHRQELNKLIGKTTERGLTIVPIRLYFKNGRIKVAIALAKGKKTFDKRETIRRREADRETRAAVKTRRV